MNAALKPLRSHLAAIPVYLPPSPQSGRPGIPLERRSQAFEDETFLLQREAKGGDAWVETLAYSLLAGLVALWIALTVWSVRLTEGGTRSSGGSPPKPPRAVPAGV